ncbi:MAG: hypothetical protein IJ192_01840 [Clostridia bacterium]|nr:hypothetical protein [Clostridia bacterium]
MFKAIRNHDFETVKGIIEKNPETVNCVAVPPPKKDNGQSPLQVALKTGMYDIADYLIEHGADADFMEAEDDDPGMRAPVLFDAINAVLSELCYYHHELSGYDKSRIEASDKALTLVEKILDHGADVNRFNSEGMDAWEWTVHKAENLLSAAHPTEVCTMMNSCRSPTV